MPKFKTNTIRTAREALRQNAKPYSTKQKPRYSDRLLVATDELMNEGQITFTVGDVIEKVKKQHESLTDSTKLKKIASCIRKLMNSMQENNYLDYNQFSDEYQMTLDTLEMMQQVKDKLNEIPPCQISTTTKRYHAHCSLINGRTGTFQIRRLNLRQMNKAYEKLEDETAAHVCPDLRMPDAWLDDGPDNADDASVSNVDVGADDAGTDIDMEDADEGFGQSLTRRTHSMSTPTRRKSVGDPALAYPSPDSNRRTRDRDRPLRDSPPPSPTRATASGSNNSCAGPMNIDKSSTPTVSEYANIPSPKALGCHIETLSAALSITTPEPSLELIEKTLQAKLSQLAQKDTEIKELKDKLDSTLEQLRELEHQKRQFEEQCTQLERAERDLEEVVTEKAMLEAQRTMICDEKEVLRQMRDEAVTELAELRQQMELAAQNLFATARGRA